MIEESKKLQETLVAMRRELHMIPEVGNNLPMTRAYVTAKLDEMSVPYELNENGDSGLVAYINRGKAGKCLALRADMDALPIREETGLPFASDNGCMHACGHDSHMAMLLGAVKILNEHRDELRGEVRFFFQTAEEIAKGARKMLENHAMDGVDAVFGTHIGNLCGKDIPAGTIHATPGPIMASYDRFVITCRGIGCHGSTPEKGIDPVIIAAHVALGLENIVAREVAATDPAVVTIGRISGGSQYNIIPGEVVIEGTTRAFDEKVRQHLARRIGEIAEHTAAAYGGSAEFVMDWGAPPVVNDSEMAAFAAACAAEVVGDEWVVTHVDKPNMVGEDFAYYLQEAPGAFLFLSAVNPAEVPGSDIAHHNSRFTVDEAVLWEGTATFVNIAAKFLA